MSLSSGTGSATAWDVGGRVNHEPSPHAEDGKARLAVADECANGLLGTNGGELREVEKRKKKRNPRNKKRGTGFEGESNYYLKVAVKIPLPCKRGPQADISPRVLL